MPSDYDIALQCQRQYEGEIPVTTVAGIDFSVVIDDTNRVVNVITEGSHNMRDAMRDLDAFMEPVEGFGQLHGGAWEGVPDAAKIIRGQLRYDYLTRLQGHSLGAMHAVYLTMLLGRAGFHNIECVTFGLPLFGDLAAIENFNNYRNRSYQNYLDLFNHDLFTTIPVHLLSEPYVPPPNRIRFWSAPTEKNEYASFGRLVEAHSLEDCYLPGLKKLCAVSW